VRAPQSYRNANLERSPRAIAGRGLTAFGVWARWIGVRWVGVAIAVLNAMVQMIAMPAYPFWSLCLIALDVLLIYGLIAHGSRSRA
jgi:hypothetical protein